MDIEKLDKITNYVQERVDDLLRMGVSRISYWRARILAEEVLKEAACCQCASEDEMVNDCESCPGWNPDSQECCGGYGLIGETSDDDDFERTDRELELEDTLADLRNGIELWKQTKLASFGDWSDHDEALLRWVEHGGNS